MSIWAHSAVMSYTISWHWFLMNDFVFSLNVYMTRSADLRPPFLCVVIDHQFTFDAVAYVDSTQVKISWMKCQG